MKVNLQHMGMFWREGTGQDGAFWKESSRGREGGKMVTGM